MKNEADKIAKELFQKIGTESPSRDFKNNVMEKIYSLEKSKPKAYEPLLSKKIIALVSSVISVLIAILFLTGSSSKSLKFPFEFNFEPSFPQVNIPDLALSFSQYNIPSVWLYIALAFPMFFVFERLGQKLWDKGFRWPPERRTETNGGLPH